MRRPPSCLLLCRPRRRRTDGSSLESPRQTDDERGGDGPLRRLVDADPLCRRGRVEREGPARIEAQRRAAAQTREGRERIAARAAIIAAENRPAAGGDRERELQPIAGTPERPARAELDERAETIEVIAGRSGGARRAGERRAGAGEHRAPALAVAKLETDLGARQRQRRAAEGRGDADEVRRGVGRAGRLAPRGVRGGERRNGFGRERRTERRCAGIERVDAGLFAPR